MFRAVRKIMLAAEMKSADAVVRVLLIETLAARRALEAIPELLLMAKDTNPLVRAAAMTALGQLASTEHLPGLIQAVLSAEPGREREAAVS